MYMVFLVWRSSIYLNICNCHKVHPPMRCEPPGFCLSIIANDRPKERSISSYLVSVLLNTKSRHLSPHKWYIHPSHTSPQPSVFSAQNNVLISLISLLTGQVALGRKLSNRRATSLTQHRLLLREPVPRCILLVVQLQRHTSNVGCSKEEPVRLAIIGEDLAQISSSPLSRDFLSQTPVQGRPLRTATSHSNRVVHQVRREALDFVAAQPLIIDACVFRSLTRDESLWVVSRSPA